MSGFGKIFFPTRLAIQIPYTLYLSPLCDKTRAFIYPAVDSSSKQLNPRFYIARNKSTQGSSRLKYPEGTGIDVFLVIFVSINK